MQHIQQTITNAFLSKGYQLQSPITRQQVIKCITVLVKQKNTHYSTQAVNQAIFNEIWNETQARVHQIQKQELIQELREQQQEDRKNEQLRNLSKERRESIDKFVRRNSGNYYQSSNGEREAEHQQQREGENQRDSKPRTISPLSRVQYIINDPTLMPRLTPTVLLSDFVQSLSDAIQILLNRVAECKNTLEEMLLKQKQLEQYKQFAKAEIIYHKSMTLKQDMRQFEGDLVILTYPFDAGKGDMLRRLTMRKNSGEKMGHIVTKKSLQVDTQQQSSTAANRTDSITKRQHQQAQTAATTTQQQQQLRRTQSIRKTATNTNNNLLAQSSPVAVEPAILNKATTLLQQTNLLNINTNNNQLFKQLQTYQKQHPNQRLQAQTVVDAKSITISVLGLLLILQCTVVVVKYTFLDLMVYLLGFFVLLIDEHKPGMARVAFYGGLFSLFMDGMWLALNSIEYFNLFPNFQTLRLTSHQNGLTTNIFTNRTYQLYIWFAAIIQMIVKILYLILLRRFSLLQTIYWQQVMREQNIVIQQEEDYSFQSKNKQLVDHYIPDMKELLKIENTKK